jgi:hypothetical protein
MSRVAILFALACAGCTDWASLGRNLGRPDQAGDGALTRTVQLAQLTYTSVTTMPVSASATLPGAQTAGDLLVVAIGWQGPGTISFVTDSVGDDYEVGAPIAGITNQDQAIYYALGVHGAGAAANSIQIEFDQVVSFPDLILLEYTGLGPSARFLAGASATGTDATAASAALDAEAGDLLVGAGTTSLEFADAGPGWTQRVITQPGGDLAEDMIPSTSGTFPATGAAQGSWVMQVVAFRPTP